MIEHHSILSSIFKNSDEPVHMLFKLFMHKSFIAVFDLNAETFPTQHFTLLI